MNTKLYLLRVNLPLVFFLFQRRLRGVVGTSFLLVSLLLYEKPAQAIEILEPAPNAHVVPGQMLKVSIAPSPGQEISAATVLLSSGEQVQAAQSSTTPGNFEASVRVPSDAVCPEFLSVSAVVTGAGPMFRVVEVYANPGQPTSLSLNVPTRMTVKGKLVLATVRGTFPDGTSRDLSDPECGTVFSATNQDVIISNPSGLLQPLGNGTATISVSSWGLTATKDITVELTLANLANHIPVPVVSDLTTTRETSIYLDATQSSDADDGDILRFAWKQVDGRIVVLEDANTAKPFFLTPYVEQERVLTFSLTVTDSKGASSMPKLVKVTVLPVAPVAPVPPTQ